MMPTRKSPAKKSTAKKKTPAEKAPAKKSTPRKRAAKPAPKAATTGKLHKVARSIGSTLGSIAKKTSTAVKAAKQALPGSGAAPDETLPDSE